MPGLEVDMDGGMQGWYPNILINCVGSWAWAGTGTTEVGVHVMSNDGLSIYFIVQRVVPLTSAGKQWEWKGMPVRQRVCMIALESNRRIRWILYISDVDVDRWMDRSYPHIPHTLSIHTW